MKPKKSANEEQWVKADADIETVVKLLKKKELQTKILKKILPENKPSENKPV